MRIIIINGPNLNLLGRRETSIYGTLSMEQVLLAIQRTYPEVYFEYYQSNHEGDLIDWIQAFGGEQQESAEAKSEKAIGMALNAGGYTHTSIALRDAVACSEVPIVEVHITDITQREEFRRVSLLTDVCAHTIMGQGTNGYKQAIEWIINKQA
jgi:3-dehydroquinate dehydratase-2